MRRRLKDIESRLPPGFRFHPSDEELICYYLRAKVFSSRHRQSSSSSQSSQLMAFSSAAAVNLLVEVDLHLREPWDLPVAAKLGGDKQEWYFFSSRDRKYATGSRTNRATPHGYWKATGKDKVIHGIDDDEHGNGTTKMVVVGMRKTLVFYFGRAPNGRKSDWVMHEFRLVTSASSTSSPAAARQTPPPPMEEEDWVLCRVFHKGKGGEANTIAGGSNNDRLVHMPSHRSIGGVDDGGQFLFPIGVSSSPQTISISGGQHQLQLVVGDDHGGLIVGQQRDAVPDDHPFPLLQAAADHGFFVEPIFFENGKSYEPIFEWPHYHYGENCIRETTEMPPLLQQGGIDP